MRGSIRTVPVSTGSSKRSARRSRRASASESTRRDVHSTRHSSLTLDSRRQHTHWGCTSDIIAALSPSDPASRNPQEAFMAEFEATEIDGLSGPASSERESTNPSFFAISLDPGARSSRRALEWVGVCGIASVARRALSEDSQQRDAAGDSLRVVASRHRARSARDRGAEGQRAGATAGAAAAGRQANPAGPEPSPGRPGGGGRAGQQQFALE